MTDTATNGTIEGGDPSTSNTSLTATHDPACAHNMPRCMIAGQRWSKTVQILHAGSPRR
jgi:hypothetical protein